MEPKKIITFGVLAVATLLVFTQVRKLGTSPAQSAQPFETQAPIIVETQLAQVLVSNQTIYMGTRLSPEMLKWQEWPEAALTDSLITEEIFPSALEELSGTVVRSEITDGEPINRRKLVRADDRSVMSALLKPGMRAVSVQISPDTAASGFINPGDRVDIIMTEENEDQNYSELGRSNGPTYFANTIFENVEVMAIDQTFKTAEDGTATVVGSIALFQLSQDDAEVLTEADSVGELSLTLRGLSGSHDISAPSAATIVQATKEETRVSSLKIYRSGKTEEVTLKDN